MRISKLLPFALLMTIGGISIINPNMEFVRVLDMKAIELLACVAIKWSLINIVESFENPKNVRLGLFFHNTVKTIIILSFYIVLVYLSIETVLFFVPK